MVEVVVEVGERESVKGFVVKWVGMEGVKVMGKKGGRSPPPARPKAERARPWAEPRQCSVKSIAFGGVPGWWGEDWVVEGPCPSLVGRCVIVVSDW